MLAHIIGWILVGFAVLVLVAGARALFILPPGRASFFEIGAHVIGTVLAVWLLCGVFLGLALACFI
jgi:hypothetical protein